MEFKKLSIKNGKVSLKYQEYKDLEDKLNNREVIIKVDKAGICRTDIFVSNGIIPVDKETTLGHEFSGTIFKSNSLNFNEGDYVVVNPIFKDNSMLGLEHDGCFAEFVIVNEDQVYKFPSNLNAKLSAYIEPLAASLAPLKSKFISKDNLGAVLGENRIGQLTYSIMKKNGYNVKLIEKTENIPDCSFDYIIETLPNKKIFDEISRILKFNGTLIIKSRLRNYVEINLYNYLKKEIIIESLYYHNFEFSINYAINNYNDFIHLFGEEFPIEEWENAFNLSEKGDKKIFFKF